MRGARDIESGRTVAELVGNWPDYFHACFSPDGRRMVTGFEQPIGGLSGDVPAWRVFGARVWDLESGERVGNLWPPGMQERIFGASGVLAVLWSPDGERILTYTSLDDWTRGEKNPKGETNLVTTWDAESLQPLATRKLLVQRGQVALRYSPDGRRLRVESREGSSHGGSGISVLSERRIEIWDADTLETLCVLKGPLCSGCWSPDGRTIAAPGADGTVWICDAETGQRLKGFRGHTAAAVAKNYSADGRFMVTEGMDKTVRVWDTPAGECVMVIGPPAAEGAQPELSPDGTRLFTASFGHGGMNLWDVETGELLWSFEHDLEKRGAWQISQRDFFTPDARRMVIGDASRTRVWRRLRPEQWWGIFALYHFWLIVALSVAFAWSLWRDVRSLRRRQESPM